MCCINYQRSSSVEGNERPEQVWSDLQKSQAFEGLSKVIKGLLTVAYSSAACRRMFSMVGKTCTEDRATMLPETAEGPLVLKC